MKYLITILALCVFSQVCHACPACQASPGPLGPPKELKKELEKAVKRKKSDAILLKKIVELQNRLRSSQAKLANSLSTKSKDKSSDLDLMKEISDVKDSLDKYLHENAPEIRGMERRFGRKLDDILKAMKKEANKAKRELRKTAKEVKRDMK